MKLFASLIRRCWCLPIGKTHFFHFALRYNMVISVRMISVRGGGQWLGRCSKGRSDRNLVAKGAQGIELATQRIQAQPLRPLGHGRYKSQPKQFK